MPFRSLNRTLGRSLLRPTTRMLGSVRGPRPPNHLALACRALREAIRIGRRLRPFLAEQRRLLESHHINLEARAALDRVYGPDSADPDSLIPSAPAGGAQGKGSS